MATKSELLTAVRRFLQENETSGGFWSEVELLDYIDYALLELWQYWTSRPDNTNPWLVQHEMDASTVSGRTSLEFGAHITTTYVGVTDRVVDIYSDSNTVIPRWKVVRAQNGVDIVMFDSALAAEKTWIYAIHKPKHLKDIADNAPENEVDVPTGWTQWIVKRAVINALQKSGQDTQDLKTDTDRMLQSFGMGMKVEEGNN
tara:strand:+ start:569 stop:1171 length:603 start_codon:yes stop_codon:yes gene_type:complete